MKKYLKYLAICTAGIMVIPGCKKSFLTVTPKGTALESAYYLNQAQAFTGLVAVYDVVGYQGGNDVTKLNTMDAGSDDQHHQRGSAARLDGFYGHSRRVSGLRLLWTGLW